MPTKPRKINRSAVSGKIVSKAEALANPDETVTETVRTPEVAAAEMHALVDGFCTELTDRVRFRDREALGLTPEGMQAVMDAFRRYAAGQIHKPEAG